METTASTGAAIISDQGARISSIDSSTHSTSGTNANHVEMCVAHITILINIKRLVTIEFDH